MPRNMGRPIWVSVLLCLAGCPYPNPAFDAGEGSGSGGAGSSGGAATGEVVTGGGCELAGGPDADGDGRPDVCDPCVQDAEDDADGDGLCADVDPCPAGAEADDMDSDGIADACDPCPMGGDADMDGVCDGADLCPGADDTLDGDGDGVPDGCDLCPDMSGDADMDGVCDTIDVCPGFDDGLDADTDGVPDGCDVCPQDPENDADGDGACGDVDNCVAVANPGQMDGDGDGRGDACDVCKDPAFSDDKADYDGDGLACEVDPCLFDGPQPPGLPGSVGPLMEVTIADAKVNDGGAFAAVGAGAAVKLQYTWKVNFCECPNCYTQAMVGLDGHPPAQCFWNLGIEYNCDAYQDSATQMFTAPMQAGTYLFRFTRDYQVNKCVTDKELAPQSAFAAICVK